MFIFSSDVFEVNLDLFQTLPPPAAISAPLMNDYLRSTATILNLNYPFSPFCGSIFKCPSSPILQMCFEAYKGRQHWLNHLFRNHHLQGLVAMLTSISDASGAPGGCRDCPSCRGTEVGRSSPPTPGTGPSCLNTSLHSPHRCSHSLFPAAPQACNCSLMLALKKEGVH